MRTRNAFSLLELLVAVSVIGVLIAIVIPVLQSVAMHGHDVKNQTSLRSTHQHFRIYANDHEDCFVNAGPPDEPEIQIVVDFGVGNGWATMPYVAQAWMWPVVLAVEFGEAFPTWHSTHAMPVVTAERMFGGVERPEYATATEVYYSEAMLVDPRRFVSPGIQYDSHSFRRVRWSEVAFPANKGLLVDVARPPSLSFSGKKNIAFVDGSVARLSLAKAAPPPPGVSWPGIPVIATPLGVLGRDFVR